MADLPETIAMKIHSFSKAVAWSLVVTSFHPQCGAEEVVDLWTAASSSLDNSPINHPVTKQLRGELHFSFVGGEDPDVVGAGGVVEDVQDVEGVYGGEASDGSHGVLMKLHSSKTKAECIESCQMLGRPRATNRCINEECRGPGDDVLDEYVAGEEDFSFEDHSKAVRDGVTKDECIARCNRLRSSRAVDRCITDECGGPVVDTFETVVAKGERATLGDNMEVFKDNNDECIAHCKRLRSTRAANSCIEECGGPRSGALDEILAEENGSTFTHQFNILKNDSPNDECIAHCKRLRSTRAANRCITEECGGPGIGIHGSAVDIAIEE